MKIIFFIILSFIFSERGDLISYEFIGNKAVDDIQTQLNNDFNSLSPEALYDVDLYAIIYETIDQFGDVTIASGLVSYPVDSPNAHPIYTFQHGTEIRRNGAPSMNGFNSLVLWLSTRGYIFVESDFLGLGVSEMLHPYHLKDVTASTVIDMLIASKQFCDNFVNVQYNDQLYLAGYSEGGYATMAAVKEIEENYSNEISITASFPMAGAYDLSGTMVDLMLLEEPYPDPYYLPYFVLSYIEKYSMGEVEDFFLPEYAEILPELFNGDFSGGYINSFLPDIPIHMMKPDVVEEFSNNENYIFRQHLEENDLWNWSPINPMYLFHGMADESVPVENTIITYDHFIANGSTSVYSELLPESYGGHSDAALYCLLIAYDISENSKVFSSKGDINSDQIINVLDIILIVNYIIDDITVSNFNNWLMDFNSDTIVNVLDIIGLLNLIIEN